MNQLFILHPSTAVPEEELEDQIDLSSFSGNLRRDDDDKSRNCWRVPDGKLFKVRSKNFPNDKSKVYCYFSTITFSCL